MMDANEAALDRYLMRQAIASIELEHFQREAKERIEELFNWAKNYEDKDYTEELELLIEER